MRNSWNPALTLTQVSLCCDGGLAGGEGGQLCRPRPSRSFSLGQPPPQFGCLCLSGVGAQEGPCVCALDIHSLMLSVIPSRTWSATKCRLAQSVSSPRAEQAELG